MFAVTEAEAAVIRVAFDQGGECARTIAAWKPLPLRKIGRLVSARQGRMAPPPR
jgi:hypothetical protein